VIRRAGCVDAHVRIRGGPAGVTWPAYPTRAARVHQRRGGVRGAVGRRPTVRGAACGAIRPIRSALPPLGVSRTRVGAHRG
jgi:hypothetical protein